MTPPMKSQSSNPATGRVTRYLWLLWVLWLSFLIYPVNALFHAHPASVRLTLVLAATVLFAVLYGWNVWRSLGRITSGRTVEGTWPVIVTLAAIALTLTLADRRDWIELFIFVGVSLGPSLPAAVAARGLGMVVALVIVLGFAIGAGLGPIAQISLQAAVSGGAVIIVVRTVVTARELREAREEIARLAVNEERLRFARDLHDLLGHSLSLIALKSELVGKLITVAPEQAAAENRDVETVARRALGEVREAVAAYRQPNLTAELASAQQILAAAGISYERRGALQPLPAALESVLAWTVREGVTNVIKHSRASCCTIHLRNERAHIGVEVIDDGRGLPDPAAAGAGTGLSGLGERVAALGGRHTAGPDPGGGFRLAVLLPTSAPSELSGARPPDQQHDFDAVTSV